ncbi:GyrI-like domain-containing protein [Paenibacillus odorifer]|uniref:GyrI-like domain-containing protein n=1 Tax=Paenibacillus odorifer TaxID=189426 RepID=UPI0012D30636|nr:effector binding domain-containing protein [Paenibacillus odorifer]
MMNTYFVEKAKMTLAGVSIRTTNEVEMGPDGGLPQLWETYFQSNIAGQVATVNPEYIYALYTDYESDASGAYTVVIGHEVAEERHLEGNQLEENGLEESELEESELEENELEKSELEESELEESELEENELEKNELEKNQLEETQFTYAAVPESKYMVFTTKKGPVFEVVAQAWGEIWAYFKESREARTYTGDFEIYDSRNFDPADTQVEIYIAIE